MCQFLHILYKPFSDSFSQSVRRSVIISVQELCKTFMSKDKTDKMRNYELLCRSEDERDAAIQRVEELQEALDGIQKKSKERSKKVLKVNAKYLKESIFGEIIS